MTIKAIETRYKGYRFRSRLEARWAVFFDALGLDWEYEPEGFDLGEAGWYLPDFRVTLKSGKVLWVEVKPQNNGRKVAPRETEKRIYFAGKVKKNCWRHTIVPDLRDHSPMHSSQEDPPAPFHIGRANVYTGPFFVRCDHGCAHGSKTHGRGKQGCAEQDAPSEVDEWQDFVLGECLKQIDGSTHVFAWIDSLDCYGTLAEIGYAKARGKTIYVAFSEKLTKNEDYFKYEDDGGGHVFLAGGRSELWFIEAMSDGCCYHRESAKEGFSWFFPDKTELDADVKKIAAVGKSHKSMWMLTNGDPLTGGHVVRSEGPSLRLEGVCDALSSPATAATTAAAATKARSARFEHGECG